jgi:hypothetical protein
VRFVGEKRTEEEYGVRKFGFLIAVLALVSVSAPAFAANPFMDVPSGHWAYDAIGQLAASGVLSGYPDGTYKGNQPATRYEMASALARSLANVNMAKASKQDVEMLKRLVMEFRDELDALGVRADKIDRRVAQLESDIGGWKVTGSFLISMKWAKEEGTLYATAGKTDYAFPEDDNYIDFEKRVDDKVTFSARFQYDGEDGILWRRMYLTVALPWDISMRVGKFYVEYEGGFFDEDCGDSTFMYKSNWKGLEFTKLFSMGSWYFLVAHQEESDSDGYPDAAYGWSEVEANLFHMGVRLDFNERFSLGLNGMLFDQQDDDGLTWKTSDRSVYWADFTVNFTNAVAFKGAFYGQKWDIKGGYDDSPKAWKAIVDIKQDALKFTDLWLEYAKLDASFAPMNDPFDSTPGNVAFLSVREEEDIRNPGRDSEMSWVFLSARQQWSDQWTTFFRYGAFDYDKAPLADGTYSDRTMCGLGVRYYYTPALMFELAYDQVDFDHSARLDDSAVRLKTQVSF